VTFTNEFKLLNEVRKNLAAPGKQLLRCSTIGTPHRYIPVGDLDRSPLFAIFPLNFVPFMQYAG